MNEVFVSYRRSDSSTVVGRIIDRLESYFGQERIFRDLDSIDYGQNFDEVMAGAITECKICLAIIGDDWIDELGNRRIENAEDWVRIELSGALKQGVHIIPVLVENAAMPERTQLPDNLKSLSTLNAAKVRDDPDFNADMERLCISMDKYLLNASPDSGSSLDGAGTSLWQKVSNKTVAMVIVGGGLFIASVSALTYVSYNDNPTPPVQIGVYDSNAKVLKNPFELKSSEDFRVIQFEVDGALSNYKKQSEGAWFKIENIPGGPDRQFPFYDFNIDSPVSSRAPVFHVTIQNQSDNELVIAKVLYRVYDIDAFKGGGFGPLSPAAMYRQGIHWSKGDQLAAMVPAFGIDAKKSGSFLLEVHSLDEGVHLGWLLEIFFIDAEGNSAGTDLFGVTMQK